MGGGDHEWGGLINRGVNWGGGSSLIGEIRFGGGVSIQGGGGLYSRTLTPLWGGSQFGVGSLFEVIDPTWGGSLLEVIDPTVGGGGLNLGGGLYSRSLTPLGGGLY